MGLAMQVANEVTLSYRQERFSRIREGNVKRPDECIRGGKIKVLFNFCPVEFTGASVILEVNPQRVELENDFVWIFAGGTPPNDFLKKIRVQFGTKDMTQETSEEAEQARLASQQFAEARAGAG